MGQLYDANVIYDWNGTYDDGLPVPIVPPNKISSVRMAYVDSVARQAPQNFPIEDGVPGSSPIRATLDPAQPRDSSSRLPWLDAIAKQSNIRLRLDAAAKRENDVRALWSGLSAKSADTRLVLDAAAARLSSMIRGRWAGVTGRQAATAIAWAVALAKNSATTLPWGDAIAKNAFVRIRWRPGYPYQSGYALPFAGEPDPPPGSTIIIPPSDIYFMIPALSIIRDSDGADLNAIDASVRLDRSSYAWTLDGTIPLSSLDLVNPNTNSEPVLVDATINGYPWKFIVEGYTDNRKFGGSGCKIRARSQSALLGNPYAARSTFTSSANADASQLATNLMPFGWSLTWSTQDWLVPAGLFSYADLAPIDALAQLVNAVGACIYPDQSAQELTINPLYPTSPWNWDSASPYADVPASFIAELSGQWEGNFKTDYNGIYVSGQNAGVIGKVKRTGSAGDVLLPTVTDVLLCVTAANVERGRVELAKAGKRKTETIRVPLLPPGGSGNPGVFQPGQLLQISEPDIITSAGTIAGSTWRAQIVSVQIDARHSSAPGSALSVRQTLVVERHQ